MQGQKCPFNFILRVFSSLLSQPQSRETGRSHLSVPESHLECLAQAGEEEGGDRQAHSQERKRRCEMSHRGSGCRWDTSLGCVEWSRGRWTWKPEGQGRKRGLRRGLAGGGDEARGLQGCASEWLGGWKSFAMGQAAHGRPIRSLQGPRPPPARSQGKENGDERC